MEIINKKQISLKESPDPSLSGLCTRLLLTLSVIALLVFIDIVSPEAAAEHKHGKIKDTASYIAMLEEQERKDWQKPSEVLKALNLSKGDVVADIGAGTGYFSRLFAEAVGENGTVYAVDIDEKLLDYLKKKAEDAGIKNIKIVKSEPNNPLLVHLKRIDLVFICNTWHHIEKRHKYLQLLHESLKPAGKLVMVDFVAKETPFGPPLSKRIPRNKLVEECEQAKFSLYGEYHFLPYQYFLIFSKN
ncbi:MAG: class I SAM-dependent methyltransferase [Candidatus Brocadiales bacterium]